MLKEKTQADNQSKLLLQNRSDLREEISTSSQAPDIYCFT